MLLAHDGEQPRHVFVGCSDGVARSHTAATIATSLMRCSGRSAAISRLRSTCKPSSPSRQQAGLSGAGRLGEWDEIVPLIAFLCTADAQWISTQTIRVNGGMTA